MRRLFTFLAFVLGLSLSAAAQNSCPAGSVANVLGTTCTIGDLSFTFGTDFNGFKQFGDGSQVFTEPIDPSEIGFAPVAQSGQSGFTLTGNFEEPGLAFVSGHFAGFPYTVQTLGTNVITQETATLVGNVTGINFTNIAVFDEQCYPGGGCVVLGPTINFTPQFGLFSDPVQTFTFPGPVCRSESGQHAINSFAFTGATALLNTSTILYTTTLPPEPQSTPPITDIGTLGGSLSFPSVINSSGQVVGDAFTRCDEADHAFRWQNGVMTDLGTLGGDFSFATAINQSGEVVGTAALPSPQGSHAFFWDGTMHDLGTLGGRTSGANAINTQHEIVGQAQVLTIDPHTRRQAQRAVLWRKETMTELGTLGGAASAAFGINNRGQIVGQSNVTLARDPILGVPVVHSFLYQAGTMTDLGPILGGKINWANDINESGQIVGGSNVSGDAVERAYLWDNGTVTDLGTLPGDSSSGALTINNKGQIVGISADSNNPSNPVFFFCPCHAVLWENGQIIDLNSFVPAGSGWELLLAAGINNQGQIVGSASRNGSSVGFLLTLPDPAAGQPHASIVATGESGMKAIAVAGSVKQISIRTDGERRVQIERKTKP